MKKLITLFFISILSLQVYCSAQEILKVDYPAIKEYVTNHNTEFQKLMQRFEENDTLLTRQDHAMLYYGYSFTPAYKGSMDDSQDFRKLIKEEKYEDAYNIGKELLKKNPVSLQLLYNMYGIAGLLQKDIREIKHYSKRYAALLTMIALTGDGTSEETAFKVICVNDEMASVFYPILQKREKSIGRDIMLVGFDDSPFAVKMDPPLASVKADAYAMGYRAVEKAVNALSGKNDTDHYCKTEFIPRASCSSESLYLSNMNNVFSGDDTVIAENIINYIYQSSIPAETYEQVKQFCLKMVAELRSRIINRTADADDLKYLSDKTEEFLSSNRYGVELVPRMIETVDGCHKWLMRNAPAENVSVINRIFKYAVIKISNGMINDFKKLEDSQKEHTHLSNLFTRDTLMFNENMAMSYARMMNKFYCLDIKSSYLFLIDEPAEYHNNGEFPKNLKWKFMSYQDGMNFSMVPANERDVSSEYMYRNKYISDSERHTFIIADLYSREYQYGLLLCEPTSDKFFADLELVVYQVSAAVKLINLISEQDRINEKLHMKNIALENLSEIDEMTGIYNRRGFYRAAEAFIESSKGKDIIVCYADMDNLKLVNDGYGHSEGDFSIKSLALCLKEAFGENGIVGRMGGDEFAAFILSEKTEGIESIIGKKRRYIEHLNRTANKPYHIDMSMGFCECVCENSYDFKEAVDKADGKLYDNKTERKRKNKNKVSETDH